jgi:deazaflavin-dependent oxidoreductase (nitroreductase family)
MLTGASRVNPMMYLADDGDPRRVLVFASAAGADANPAWFTNFVANPHDVTVEIGSERRRADAEVLAEPARARTFATQAARYPGFAAYQAKTTRRIPVVALSLRAADVPSSPSASGASNGH